MADKFTRFISGVGQGLLNPKGNLGDARHAARLYVDNQFARAPRTKFLYHVAFDIAEPALLSKKFSDKRKEVSMLVKGADLPRITIDHDIKNQYNRKRVIYKELKYEPLNISFHDDNIGIVNALWAQYLSYYSPERLNPVEAWTDTSFGPYKSIDGEKSKWNYGLDRSKGTSSTYYGPDATAYTKPFFRSITLYTLSRKKFNSYTLINPHIVSWNHGNLDQNSNNGTVEAQMSLVYESILYGTGSVIKGKEPTGFADLFYDKTPSPLSIGGGTLSSVFGPGGLLAAGSSIIEDAQTIYGEGNVQEAGIGPLGLGTIISAANFYKSIRSISKESLIAEATNLITSPGAFSNAVSGLQGVSFGAQQSAREAGFFRTTPNVPL
jgi:hypothetical protein